MLQILGISICTSSTLYFNTDFKYLLHFPGPDIFYMTAKKGVKLSILPRYTL